MIIRDRDGTPWARVSCVLPLDAAAAWTLVADARHHARWVPLTRVALTAPGAGDRVHRPDDQAPEAGDEIAAVSGPFARQGAPGLLDRMRVERFEPPLGAVPGAAVFVKLGPVLLGTARIEVEAAGPSSSRVEWSEAIYLRGLPRAWTVWAGAVLVDLMLRLVLARAAREARPRPTQRTAA